MAKLNEVLGEFGEWLNDQGLLVPDSLSDDDRSCEELANDFMKERFPG